MTTILTQAQVTGLLSQAAVAATYPATNANGVLLPDWYFNDDGIPVYSGAEIATRGVGIYGQTTANLVLVGALKSAALALITSPAMTLTVLNTPAVWTGIYDINSLADYLNSTTVQNQFELALYEGAYQGLIDAGVIVGTEIDRYIATFLQPAVKYGVDNVVAWLQGKTAPDLSLAILIAARQGQYAIDFVNTYGKVLNVAASPVISNNTVIRDQVDQAVSQVIDNPRIANLVYANTEAIIASETVAANIASVIGNVLISIPPSNTDDGTFRFAPGYRQG